MSKPSGKQPRVADYSQASAAERESVIKILEQKLELLKKRRGSESLDELERDIEHFKTKIRAGGIIAGKEFEKLVRLFRI
ncbi:MAG: hypothetical protein D6814_05865 [Calditrichaeota bacterium]|nr:MAG: hypothetical protein D6814_05865 [Calditrichota bacterium]